MTTKELIQSEIDQLDEKYLDELYKVIQGFAQSKINDEDIDEDEDEEDDDTTLEEIYEYARKYHLLKNGRPKPESTDKRPFSDRINDLKFHGPSDLSTNHDFYVLGEKPR